MTTFSHRLAISTAAASLALGTAPAIADTVLPAPYVSRALDAVLLPIDADVRSVFELANNDTGLLVLATQPAGVAEAYGIVPGDVIHLIGGQQVTRPMELDEIVYYWILEGVFDFDLGVYRDGGYVEVVITISVDSYWEVIDVTTVETWSSLEVETSFSYEEYTAEYSEEIVESYEYTETTIEETVTSEEFTTEMSVENYEESGDEVTEEVSEGEMDDGSEEEFSDESADEMVSEDEASNEEESAEEEFVEEEADEEVAEEESVDEEESYDEPEEEGFDDGGDEG